MVNKMKVLVVDDYLDNLITIEALIEEYFKDTLILTAQSGEEGLNIARLEIPDIIILDILMPGMDGFEVCSKIKSDPLLKDIPVVFVTASEGDRDLRVKALDFGAEGFIVKPIRSTELVAQIRAMYKIRLSVIKKLNEKIKLQDMVDAQTKALTDAYHQAESLNHELKIENEQRIKKERELLDAQHLAKVGSFEVSTIDRKIKATEQLWKILDVTPADFILIEELYDSTVYKDDLEFVQECINNVVKTSFIDFNCRILAYGRIEYVHCRFSYSQSTGVIQGTVQNITENKLKEQELELARIEAEQATFTQSKFLSNMSHEIRTPLNGILGMIDLTLMSELDDELIDNLNIAKSSAKSLLSIIGDILDYSKIETNSFTFNENWIDLKMELNTICRRYKAQSVDKNLEFKYSYDEDIPDLLFTDSERIIQVINNLLSNALKFTKSGEVELNIKLHHKDAEFATIECIVSDTGIGIEKGHVHKLFNKFSQVDSTSTKQFGGTGLGLAISKQIVDLMHGKITYKDRKEKGSLFSFVLPIKYKNHKIKVSDISKKQDHIPKILVVDDDAVNRRIFTLLLEKSKYCVDTSYNGLEALNAIKKIDYDVIFMDISMPIMDGITAVKAIRQLGKTVPIVAITAFAKESIKTNSLATGFDAYITKPVDFKTINSILEDLIGVVNG